MRSIEYLIQLFPEKTGKELLEIQAQDKADDEYNYQIANKATLEYIEDIKKNGGYFRGRFGIDQRFMYKITDIYMDNDKVYVDVEKIVIFLGNERGVVKSGEFTFEKKSDTYVEADKYGFNCYDRVTEKEWNELIDYIHGVDKFWSMYKPVE